LGSRLYGQAPGLFGYAGYGYCASYSGWHWGCKLLLICICDGTVNGFQPGEPKLHGERDQARQTLELVRSSPGSSQPTSARTARLVFQSLYQ
jgi:hypothetical protein